MIGTIEECRLKACVGMTALAIRSCRASEELPVMNIFVAILAAVM